MKNRKKRSARVWIVAGLLFAPVLYVLSIGPIARWTSDMDDADTSVVWAVYSPVMVMMDLPVIGPGLQLYCQLWMDPEHAWSEICELAAAEPALEFLGLEKSVGVSRIFVGGTPLRGVDFDFAAIEEGNAESAIQQASFNVEAKPSRFELRIARPPAGPDESNEPAVLLASAGDYTEWRELRQVRGTPPEQSGRVFSLRGGVRFKSPDESLVIECDRAGVEFTFAEGSTTAIHRVTMHLGGNVRWISGDFKAEAQMLGIDIGGPEFESPSGVPFTFVEFRESPRFSSETTIGQTVEMSFQFDSTQDGSFGIPAAIRLSGNAVVETSRTPGGPAERVAGDRLRFLPLKNEVRED